MLGEMTTVFRVSACKVVRKKLVRVRYCHKQLLDGLYGIIEPKAEMLAAERAVRARSVKPFMPRLITGA